MKISKDFYGGNIELIKIINNTVYLKNEVRDSAEDWFYWCFKVENAGGKTVTFKFENNNRVGYYGAAVSYDYKNWKWQYADGGHNGDGFVYTFAEDENEVYFAHDMLYRPERFFDFAKENNLKIKTLCNTKKGREVPFVDINTGDEVILLTARHHACESTGSYVLEGVLKGIINDDAFNKYRIICVPMVDFDGVIDGDQGKARKPHDHNRDYDKNKLPIYETTAKTREMADNLNVKFALDFHSPWHLGGENDTVFFPINSESSIESVTQFSKILEERNLGDTLPFDKANNKMPDVDWNKSGMPMFITFCGDSAVLAATLETPYFCAENTPFSPEKAINLGENFAKALKKFMNNENGKN